MKLGRYAEYLLIGEERVEASSEREFEVLIRRLRGYQLSRMPRGVSIVPCDPVIGSRDLQPRGPRFERTKTGVLLGHDEVAFFADDDSPVTTDLHVFFQESVDRGTALLKPLADDRRLVKHVSAFYEDIAYLSYAIKLRDQSFEEAAEFMLALNSRIYNGCAMPSIFICHASEDKPFVEKLVRELDKRCLYAWYDRREILVGDSIVESINNALSEVRYVVAILSPRSVNKPWVKRELGSTLMRQLQAKNVEVLPVLLEECELPSLLADVKYADFTESFDSGLAQLLTVVRGRRRRLT